MHKAVFALYPPCGYAGTRLQELADYLLLISLMMTFFSQEPTGKESKHNNEASLWRMF
jgi:hypothetical protein